MKRPTSTSFTVAGGSRLCVLSLDAPQAPHLGAGVHEVVKVLQRRLVVLEGRGLDGQPPLAAGDLRRARGAEAEDADDLHPAAAVVNFTAGLALSVATKAEDADDLRPAAALVNFTAG